MRERPQQQAGADEKHDGERHFTDDERGAIALLAATLACTPAKLLEGCLQIKAGSFPGRRQAKANGCQERNHQRESEDAGVETHIRHLSELHGIFCEEDQRPAGP